MKHRLLHILIITLFTNGHCLAMTMPQNNPYINPAFFSNVSQHYPSMMLNQASMPMMGYNNPFGLYASQVEADQILSEIKKILITLAPLSRNLEVLAQQRQMGALDPLATSCAEEYKSMMSEEEKKEPYNILHKLDTELRGLEERIQKHQKTAGTTVFSTYAENQRRHTRNLIITSGLTTYVASRLSEEFSTLAALALAGIKNTLSTNKSKHKIPEKKRNEIKNFLVTGNSITTPPSLENAWYPKSTKYAIAKIFADFKKNAKEKYIQLQSLKQVITPFPEIQECSNLLRTLNELEKTCVRCFGPDFEKKQKSLLNKAHTKH